MAVLVLQYRNGEGVFGRAIDRLADDVGGLVAIKGGAKDLNLEIDFTARHALQEVMNCLINVVDIARKIVKRPVPLEILDDLANRATQAVILGVITAIGLGLVTLDVFGGNARPNKDEIVVEIIAVQDLGRHRVEEGLGQFRLLVIEQQPDIEQLDLLPGSVVDRGGIELVAQALDAFIDPVIVKADALLDGLVHAQPVSLLEPGFRFTAGLAEQRVMLVEALNHGQGDLVCVGAVEADGYFHGRKA